MIFEEWVSLAAAGFTTSAVMGLFQKRSGKLLLTKGSFVLAWAGLVFLVIGFIIRWRFYHESMQCSWLQAFPVSTFYESVVFLVFSMALTCLLFFRKIRSSQYIWSASMITAAAILLFLNFSTVPSEPVLFLPSLKSYWLVAHATLSFVAYALFALAAIASVIILTDRTGSLGSRWVEYVRALVVNGTLIFMVGGLIFGAIWAQQSWGRFWAWDPKETWALITWSAYLTLLHVDSRKQLSSRRFALGAVLCFVLVIFTYLGVNVLFAGLHSYTSLNVAGG